MLQVISIMTTEYTPKYRKFTPVHAGGIVHNIPTFNLPEAQMRDSAANLRAPLLPATEVTSVRERNAHKIRATMANALERHANLHRVFTTVPHALIGAAIESSSQNEQIPVVKKLEEDDVMLRLDLKGFSALTYQLLKGLLPREITDSRLEMLGQMTSMRIEDLQNLMLTLQNEMSRSTYNGPRELFTQFQKIFNVIQRIVTTYGGSLIGFEGDACNVIVNKMMHQVGDQMKVENASVTLQRAATMGMQIQEAFTLKEGDLKDTPLECRVGMTILRPGEEVNFFVADNFVTAVGAPVIARLYRNESGTQVGRVGMDQYAANILIPTGNRLDRHAADGEIFMVNKESFVASRRIRVPEEYHDWNITNKVVKAFTPITENDQRSPLTEPIEGKTCVVYGVIGAIDKIPGREAIEVVAEIGLKFAELKTKYGVDLLKRTGSDDHGFHSFIFDVAEADFVSPNETKSLTGEPLTYIEAAVRASTELYEYLNSQGIHCKMGVSSGTRIHGTVAGTNDSYGDTVNLAARGEQRAVGLDGSDEGIFCDIATTTHLLLNGIRVIGDAIKVEAKGFPNPLNFRAVKDMTAVAISERFLTQRMQSLGEYKNKIANPTPEQIKVDIERLFDQLNITERANGHLPDILNKIWEYSGIDFAKTMKPVMLVGQWQKPVSDISLAIIEAMLPDLIRALDEGEPESQIYNILSLSAALSEPVKNYYDMLKKTFIVSNADGELIDLTALMATMTAGRTMGFRMETFEEIVAGLNLNILEIPYEDGALFVETNGRTHKTEALTALKKVLETKERFLIRDEETGRHKLFGPLAQLAYRSTGSDLRRRYHGLIAEHLFTELSHRPGRFKEQKPVILSMLFHARSAGLSDYVLQYVIPTYEHYIAEGGLEAVRFYTRWATDASQGVIAIAGPALDAKSTAETLLGVADEQTLQGLSQVLSNPAVARELEPALINQLIISRAVLNAKINNRNTESVTGLELLISEYKRKLLPEGILSLNALDETNITLLSRALSGLMEIKGVKHLETNDSIQEAIDVAKVLIKSEEMKRKYPAVWSRLAYYYGRYIIYTPAEMKERQDLYRDAYDVIYSLGQQTAWSVSTMVLLNTEIHYDTIQARLLALNSTLELAKTQNVLQGVARTLNKYSQMVLELAKEGQISQSELRSIFSKLENAKMIAEGGRDYNELGFAHLRLAQYYGLNEQPDSMAAEISLAENALAKAGMPPDRVETIVKPLLVEREAGIS